MPGAGGLMKLAQRSTAEREATLEHCELCGTPIAAEHSHVLELATRDVKCACRPCGLLFERAEKMKLIPTDVYAADVDVPLERLALPVEIAFFFRTGGELKCFYPSPMGPTESLLPMALDVELEDDVQALLVYRQRQWIVGIDVCYALVGLIRTNWRGFTGGAEVWRELDKFWDGLDRRRRAWPSRATRRT
jgi:transcription elongation factor Elf1